MLDLAITFCEAHRGEWQGVQSVFPLTRLPIGHATREAMARMMAAGTLEAAGLEAQPERAGYHRLFRAPPLVANPKTQDPRPKTQTP